MCPFAVKPELFVVFKMVLTQLNGEAKKKILKHLICILQEAWKMLIEPLTPHANLPQKK